MERRRQAPQGTVVEDDGEQAADRITDLATILNIEARLPLLVNRRNFRRKRLCEGKMRNNIRAAREIAEARTTDYSAVLWGDVPIMNGSDGPYATFPGIVRAAIVGRDEALSAARGDLQRFQRPDFDTVAVDVLMAWFLDYNYFRFSFEQVRVALLFGTDPVGVSQETGVRLAVSAAQFLCGYEEEDADKRAVSAPFAALTIKEAMWGGPLPEEWI